MNPGFYNIPIGIVTPQQSEMNTKYKSAILKCRGDIYHLGFGLDVQGKLLSEEAVAGYPKEDIRVGIRRMS